MAQPNFANLKPVTTSNQPNFANLKPVTSAPELTSGQKAQQVINQAGSNINDILSSQNPDNVVTKGFEATGEAFKAVPNVVASQLPDVTQKGLSDLGNKIGARFNWLTDKISNTKLFSEIGNLQAQGYINDKTAPELNRVIQGLKTTQSAGDISNTILMADQGAKVGNKIVENVPKIASDVKNVVSSKVGDIKTNILGTPKNDLQTISDMISPKETVKQAKLAESQGRLIKGEKPTLLKGETPTRILPTDQNVKSTFTIKKYLPDAAKMDEPTLYTALDGKITEIATKLQPEMTKVPISQETIGKITDDWEALKKTQLESSDATNEPNVLKQQQQFESRLQKSEAGNMNDLWDTAKEYDASVPDNVKKANSLSSESLQNKKTIWLQNRAILRDAIKDTSTGMGKTASQAFSDMQDMYEAQNGLLSKAEVPTTLAPSKLNQAYNSTTGKVIRTIIKVGVGAEAGKKLLGL